jgi:hypothetical protein
MNLTKGLLLAMILIVFLLWNRNDRLSLFHAGHNETGIQAAGDDLKSLGRDTAHSIRKAIQ